MTIIITGANRGLGYETALALGADTSRTIVLAGRDMPSLSEAAQHIQSGTGNASCVPMQLDLAALASVRAFAAEFGTRELPPLQTIICNAGISKTTVHERSTDGYELTFAVNHLGHFLLVNLLIDQLEPPARILFVGSGVHDPAQSGGPMQPPRYVRAEWLAYPQRDPDLPDKDGVAAGQAYATSKLCNVLTVYELARRLDARGLSTPENPVTVNAFAPGLMVGTQLGRDSRGITRLMWYAMMPLLSRLMGFGGTPAQAAADLAYLATDAALAGTTARYFRGRQMVASSAESHDVDKAADLWQTSVELCRLLPSESPLVGPACASQSA
jgi:NAD(P)-dependent dehydrogenase (short-subunit alcohol dehydrogenase family)